MKSWTSGGNFESKNYHLFGLLIWQTKVMIMIQVMMRWTRNKIVRAKIALMTFGQKFLKSLFVNIGMTFALGNADVERTFSENKRILESKRTKMSDATLNAYKATSSLMTNFDKKLEDLPISQPL